MIDSKLTISLVSTTLGVALGVFFTLIYANQQKKQNILNLPIGKDHGAEDASLVSEQLSRTEQVSFYFSDCRLLTN